MKKRINTIIFFASMLALASFAASQKGFMTDFRDGKKYTTVKIGAQIWMAENLNYKTKNSYCYDDEPSNCEEYGRLYIWEAALKVCPKGWHLPSKAEFKILIEMVGGDKSGASLIPTSYYGTDDYGFSALPAGRRHRNKGDYDFKGEITAFWSYSTDQAGIPYVMRMNMDSLYFKSDLPIIIVLLNASKYTGYSVRCLKDSP